MIDVPYLQTETITDKAEQFLEEHGVDSIPIDIEWIVESKYRINIIPTPGLRREINAEAFITCDGSSIYVDEELQSRYSTRYRFTLAHEMGHLYIHGSELALCNFHTIEQWKRFMNRLDGKTHSKLEFQAYSFAGLVLVPTCHLSRQFDELLGVVDVYLEEAKRQGISRHAYLKSAQNFLADRLCVQFDVSREVIDRRIIAERLMSRLD